MSDENKVEVELMKACDETKGKDSRFVSTTIIFLGCRYGPYR